jgi:hypothetical protein
MMMKIHPSLAIGIGKARKSFGGTDGPQQKNSTDGLEQKNGTDEVAVLRSIPLSTL